MLFIVQEIDKPIPQRVRIYCPNFNDTMLFLEILHYSVTYPSHVDSSVLVVMLLLCEARRRTVFLDFLVQVIIVYSELSLCDRSVEVF